MWLKALKVVALVQLCVSGATAVVKLQDASGRPSDVQFARFLGFLATRYTPAGGTLVLCLAGLPTALPWLRGALRELPVMWLCPGGGSQLPAGRLVAFMVVGTPQRLPGLMSQLGAATDSSHWYSEAMIVVRPDEDAHDDTVNGTAAVEPLVRDLMAVAWSRSWGRTSVTVVRGEVGTLYSMAPFANASAVCGTAPPGVVPVATVRISDPVSLAALPSRMHQDDLVPRDLGGCVIRATVIVGYRDRCGYTGAVGLPFESRLVATIMEAVAQYRNVRVDWTFVGDQRIVNHDNGTFSGPLGRLAGESDVVLGTMGLTHDRLKYLRATVSFLQMPFHIQARCPEALADRPRHLSAVFRHMWAGGLWGLLLYGVASTVVLRVAVARLSGVAPPSPRWWLAVASAALLDQMSMMCEVATRAWLMCPGITSSRVLTATWLLVLLNTNVALKGLLLTEGAVSRSQSLPGTMQELLSSVPNLTVLTPSEGLRWTVNASGVPLERVVACETEREVHHCEDRFAKDRSCAVASETQPTRIKCLRGCRYTLPSVLLQSNYVSYVRRTYVLVELLDEAILRLQNGGLLERRLRLEVAKRRLKAERSRLRLRGKNRRRRSFSLDSVILLLAGLAVATLAFLAETVTHRLHAIVGTSSQRRKTACFNGAAERKERRKAEITHHNH